MTKTEAKKYGVEIGRLKTTRDSQGEYTLYEQGFIVAEGYYESAAEIKSDYISQQVDKKCNWDA